VIQQGCCKGVVAGGNLTTLCHLLGTPDTPMFENRILILEDIAEAPYKIDRKLFHLKRSGCLEGVRGIVLGDFTDCGEYDELIASIEDIFGGMGIPILAGFSFGHAQTNLTIPLGLPAVLDTAEGSLSFLEPATKSD
jgi:muramoyltetrapeptide carboxypeptidase